MSAETKQRIDKWLFFSRAVKSRSLAAKLADEGKVRINGERSKGASQSVRVGDKIEIDQDRTARILIVKGLGERRGPAPEAALLFDDQTPPPPPRNAMPEGLMAEHGGRPEKAERRAYERLRAKIFDQD
ncbi:MAG: RNA-binding S4 domain-containing protein [Rhizobiaceae bacterium]